MGDRRAASLTTVGRYVLFDEIASGGMAVVQFGRQIGDAGFSRPVAVKRLHPQFSRDPEFVAGFVDEARLAARVRHPNVVATLDVVALATELLLVLEYVHGEPLSGLARHSRELGIPVPPAVASSIVSGILHGLHAAHEARSETGEPLHIVHRDVSPHNVIVGADGIARVLDFGIAKAAVRSASTRDGQLKGKLRYMAPEQLRGEDVTRTADVYSAGVVLWETLTGERLFGSATDVAVFGMVLEGIVTPPTSLRPELPAAVDDVVIRSLARDPAARFATALEMAAALEDALPPAPSRAVGEWVERVARPVLEERARRLARVEAGAAAGGLTTAPAPRADTTGTGTPSAPPPPTRAARSTPPPLPSSTRPPAPGNAVHPSATPPAWSSSDVPRLAPLGAGAEAGRAPARSTTLTMPALEGRLADPVALGRPAYDEGHSEAGPVAPGRLAESGHVGSAPTSTATPAAAPVASPVAPAGGRRVVPWLIGGVAVAIVVALAAPARAPLVLTQARAGVGLATGRALAVAAALASRATPRSGDSARDEVGPIVIEPAGATPRRPAPPHSAGATSSASASAKPLPDCDPPYYEDETGIRRVKRECLP